MNQNQEKVILLNDGTQSNETRLGAIGSIQFAVNQIKGKRKFTSTKTLKISLRDNLKFNLKIKHFFSI